MATQVAPAGKQRTTSVPGKNSSRKNRMSLARFLKETEGQFAEWVDGEVIYQVVNEPHAANTEFAYSIMKAWVEHFDLGLVRLAPYSIKLDVRPSVREP